MPPWPQQGAPAPAVTRPTSLETWLSQHHPTSGGGGGSGPGLVPGLGTSSQAPVGASSGVNDSRADERAAALQRLLAASTYSPRWPPPGTSMSAPQPAAQPAPRPVSQSSSQPAVGSGAPRGPIFSTTAIPVPQIPAMHRPHPTAQWPLQRAQPYMHAAGRPQAAAAPQPSMAVDRNAPADAGADDGADEQDVVPLVVSDLDPQYHSQLGLSAAKEENEQKEQPKQQIQIQVPVRKKELPGGLASARGQASQKAAPKPARNGTAKDKTSRRTVTAVPVPVFTPKRTKTTTKTAVVTPPAQKRLSQEATPTQPTPPSAFSIVIPAATPRASGESSVSKAAAGAVPAGKAAPVPAAAPPPPQPLPAAGADKKPAPGSSPVVAVGRRSKSIGSIVRLKGRPKGWKPGMSYREVALRNAGIVGEEAAAFLFPPRRRRKAGSGDGGGGDKDDLRRKNEKRRRAVRSDPDRRRPNYVLAKRSGRPPAPSIESVQRAIFRSSPATFMPFLCEWAGCCAELQNMATLRRHVMVVHGRTATTCQWRRCAGRVPAVSFLGGADADADAHADPSTGDPEGATTTTTTDPAPTRMDAFREHMEYHHLAPVEWHQGDGFVNNSHLGPRQPPLTLSTLSAKSKAKERAATMAAEAARGGGGGGGGGGQTMPAGQSAANTDSRDGDDPVLAEDGGDAAAAASTAFASYNVPNEDLPRYLLDEQGRQVTPLLRDPLLELSTAFPTPEEQMRRLRELYRYRDRDR